MAATAAVVVAPTDAVLRALLQEPSHSGEVLSLQSHVDAAAVACLSLTSSLLMLERISESYAGGLDRMWRLVMRGVEQRGAALDELALAATGGEDQIVAEDADTPLRGTRPHGGFDRSIMQIESLVSMAWTLLRGDANREVAAVPRDLDVLVRAGRDARTTRDTHVAAVGAVGALGVRAADVAPRNACANFLVRTGLAATAAAQPPLDAVQRREALSTEAADALEDAVDVAGECGNALMDVFSDETYDATIYRPLGVHTAVGQMLQLLRVAMRRGTVERGSARKEHLDEIANNLQAFLAYKVANGAA
jgi:hypothetical protein